MIVVTAPIVVRELAYFIDNSPRYLKQLQALATDPDRPWLRKIVAEGLGAAEKSISELASLGASWLSTSCARRGRAARRCSRCSRWRW